MYCSYIFFFFSSRRRHTRCSRDWSSDVCSSDLNTEIVSVFAPSKYTLKSGLHVAERSMLAKDAGGSPGYRGCLKPRLTHRTRKKKGETKPQGEGDGKKGDQCSLFIGTTPTQIQGRSEEGRVGEEGRSRW